MDLRNDLIGPALPGPVRPAEEGPSSTARDAGAQGDAAAFEAALARASESRAGRQDLAGGRLTASGPGTGRGPAEGARQDNDGPEESDRSDAEAPPAGTESGATPSPGSEAAPGVARASAPVDGAEPAPMAAARIGADGRLLRESVIGEGMRLITPAAPDPDTDSLVRFALANGFDDTAVRQLFGADMVASGAGRPGIGADGMPAAWVLAARGLMLSQGDAALAVAGESVGLTGQAVLDAAVGKAAAAMSALAETMLTEALPGSPDAAQPATDEPLSGEASADTDAAGLSGMTIRLPELARAGLQASAGAPGPGAPGVEAFEAAARRLADAVAQRLVADIRSGNWQVGFALDPPELGRVEVSLHMRGGELEARFAAQHGLARDLLQEALPRLREGLQQSGMDVAQLEVGLGLQARSGGNPTPGWRGSTGSAVAASADAGDGLDQIVAPVRGREDGTVDFWA